jgi:carbon-monoxide dehydrogenase medium subunit
MKAPDFTYHAPRTIAEAIDALTRHDDARLLAGGQSLMPMLNFRLADIAHLIDISRIPELSGIVEHENHVLIKAMTTQRQLQNSALIKIYAPLLAQAVTHVGHQQTRNRGTIGGSLCHLDPGAELPVAAAALDATMIAQGPHGQRRIAFADFAAGYLTHSLAPDEILIAIEVPKTPKNSGVAFVEFNRRPADFAIVALAIQLTLSAPDIIAHIAIAIGGVADAPQRLTDLEHSLMAQNIASLKTLDATKALANIIINADDLYPAAFRRDIAATLLQRALNQALSDAGAHYE